LWSGLTLVRVIRRGLPLGECLGIDCMAGQTFFHETLLRTLVSELGSDLE